MSTKIKSGGRILSAAGIGLALIGLAAAPLQVAAQDQKAAAKPAAVESGDNMTVVRDPETGKVRAATPEEHNALLQMKAAKMRNARVAPSAPLQKWHASGASGVRMTDELVSTAVAIRKPDGGVEQQCFDSREAAEGAMKTAGNTAAKLETE